MSLFQAVVWSFLLFVFGEVEAFVELPKFNQLQLLFPGYHLQGGDYRNRDMAGLIGGNHTNPIKHLHNTSPLRMSVALNKYGGRHAIGVEPISLDDNQIASIPGQDRQQYIFYNTAFGPFLAGKYGNPQLGKPNKHDASLTMQPFLQKQGIVRLVSYHTDHAGGHIGLWDCDHFFKSPDWRLEHHLISVEFWETPDSYCAPKDNSMDLYKLLQTFRLVPRTQAPPTVRSSKLVPSGHDTHNSLQPHVGRQHPVHKVRHSHKSKLRHRLKDILRPWH